MSETPAAGARPSALAGADLAGADASDSGLTEDAGLAAERERLWR
jgi:hypothetical protein